MVYPFWGTYHSYIASSVASADARDAQRSARESATRVDELEARCDRALLVCEALWTVLRDKLNVSEEELVNTVNDIDLSDGKLDGKVRRDATDCGQCGRRVSRRFTKCMYCGHTLGVGPFAV